MNSSFPLRFDSRGRTAECGDARHVLDMIEQLLLTRQGERVNRPDFGSGLMHAVFAPNSPQIAAAIEFSTRAALQRYLGDVIEVTRLATRVEDAALTLEIDYALRGTGETGTATIQAGAE
jgi:phage baseplate assembly protein W